MAKPLVSLRTYRQLSGWNPPPQVFRALGAHCAFPEFCDSAWERQLDRCVDTVRSAALSGRHRRVSAGRRRRAAVPYSSLRLADPGKAEAGGGHEQRESITLLALRVFFLRVRLLAVRKLLRGVVALRLLRRRQAVSVDEFYTGWTWRPAQQTPVGGSAAVATSLVMAIACITAGFVMGRLSVRGPVDPTPQGAQLPSAGIGEPFTKPPERSTAVVPDAAPTTVILNPGTAEASKATGPGSSTGAGFSGSQPVRTTRRTGEHTIQDGVREDRGEPPTERDYRALRDYTLRRR